MRHSRVVPSAPRPHRISCYKPTADDWAPSFLLNTEHGLESGYPSQKMVEVIMMTLGPLDRGGNLTRLAVWGADDTYMELDFDGEFAARAVWETVLAMETVSKAELCRLGFGYEVRMVDTHPAARRGD